VNDTAQPARVALFSLLVPDYDSALEFFVGTLGFECREDTDLGKGKRWVRVAPPQGETEILLARAADDHQRSGIGDQGRGRVWLFLETENLSRDHRTMLANGVEFEGGARQEPYGTVAVFRDPWGNRWDLIEFRNRDRSGTGGPR
jgi:catechol 2,3-dioxygenase-like lactoylglutathione lyase family enzyme